MRSDSISSASGRRAKSDLAIISLGIGPSAICLENNTALIGAPFDDDAGHDSGSAYVFRKIGGFWLEEEKLQSSDAAPEDRFGLAVGIGGNILWRFDPLTGEQLVRLSQDGFLIGSALSVAMRLNRRL